MPFDGVTRNMLAADMIGHLIEHFGKREGEISCLDIAAALRTVRKRHKMKGDGAVKYILRAAATNIYPASYLSLTYLGLMIRTYAHLDNILLRARDLALGEPMRRQTFDLQLGRCICTPDRARFLSVGTGHI